MDFMLESLRADWQAFLGFSPRLLYALILLSAFWVAGSITAKVAGTLLGRGRHTQANRLLVQRLASCSASRLRSARCSTTSNQLSVTPAAIDMAAVSTSARNAMVSCSAAR